MYNSYFGFAESPFENNLDQRFLFLTEDHKEVLAALLYFIKENKAFAILCGDVGTGKTMLLNSFIDRLPTSSHPIVISNPSVEFREILDYVARTLGLDTAGMNVLEVIDAVKTALLAAQTEDKSYFLVIDEAHLLSDRSLDDIRLLSNIESHDRKLLQILLVGQYELSYKLQRPQMRQLRQRITINRFLSSMDFDETSRYVNHRLKKVGSSFKKCFDAGCLPLLYKITDGVPRQINHLCDNALLVCKAEDRKKVNKKILRKTDNALRSDLIFAPKSFKQRRSVSWLQTRVSPLAVVGVCVVFCLAILFFGYRNYFGEIGVRTIANTYQKEAGLPSQLSDRQNNETLANLTKGPIAHRQIDKRAQGVSHATDPIARNADEEYLTHKPQDSFKELPAAPPIYPDVLEVMSSDSEASLGEEQQPKRSSPAETATSQPPTSAERVEKDHGSLSPDRGLAGADKNELPPEKVMVRKGDTLSAIAYRHYGSDSKATVAAILSANPTVADKNKIYSGQILILPEAQPHYRPTQEPEAEKEIAFSIQVCILSQSSRAVAEDYASQLKQRGYPVYITEIRSKDGTRMYKICIGKYQTEAEAMDAALYYQEKEGTPYVIIKSEADSAAPSNQAEISQGFVEPERNGFSPENGEHKKQQLEDTSKEDVIPDPVEQIMP